MTSPWVSAELAARITPIGADELAAASLPSAGRRGGYDAGATDLLLARSLLALRVAEEQLSDLREAVAAARAVANGSVQPRDDRGVDSVDLAVTRWLDTLSPERVDQLVSDLAARQIVDAAIYAEGARREARDRVWVIVDLLIEAADQLDSLVAAARGSLEGQHRLAAELPAWQGRFHAAVSGAFTTLDLPQTAKARALLAVATRELVDR